MGLEDASGLIRVSSRCGMAYRKERPLRCISTFLRAIPSPPPFIKSLDNELLSRFSTISRVCACGGKHGVAWRNGEEQGPGTSCIKAKCNDVFPPSFSPAVSRFPRRLISEEAWILWHIRDWLACRMSSKLAAESVGTETGEPRWFSNLVLRCSLPRIDALSQILYLWVGEL